jgi:hypothetical protein
MTTEVTKAVEELLDATREQARTRSILETLNNQVSFADGQFRRALARVEEAKQNLHKLVQAAADPTNGQREAQKQ